MGEKLKVEAGKVVAGGYKESLTYRLPASVDVQAERDGEWLGAEEAGAFMDTMTGDIVFRVALAPDLLRAPVETQWASLQQVNGFQKRQDGLSYHSGKGLSALSVFGDFTYHCLWVGGEKWVAVTAYPHICHEYEGMPPLYDPDAILRLVLADVQAGHQPSVDERLTEIFETF